MKIRKTQQPLPPMSLRDYFAASIAQGAQVSEYDEDIEAQAEGIYKLADAMISESAKPQGEK